MFEFRLQSVLDYRENLENMAKDAYLGARSARLEAETGIQELAQRRGTLLEYTATDLNSRRALETTLLHLDDLERSQNVVLNVLVSEEETALNAWHAAKRELEVLVRLRAAALEEYNIEAERKEQTELDEWAVLRRIA